MKGLLRYLSPFAPDQSGAVAALYGMGGLIVICDAGGCTGNICGFDEPRWFKDRNEGKNAIFSAGLRDMDAILGRDEILIEKLGDAAKHLDAAFAALIGTPVPAVIATDFEAIADMARYRTGLDVLTLECTGTRLYDAGESEAWLELFRTFASDKPEIDGDRGMLGVIGCTPLDLSLVNAEPMLDLYASEHGYAGTWCYGMGAGTDEVRRAGAAAKNLVLTPAGIAAAEYLKSRFGTPYETGYPLFSKDFIERLKSLGERGGKNRILIVHQQVAANAARDIIALGAPHRRADGPGDPNLDIICGTWFMQIPELAKPQDVTFEREDGFAFFVDEGNFDVVIGDPKFKRVLRGFGGEYIECPHFAVSGILEEGI